MRRNSSWLARPLRSRWTAPVLAVAICLCGCLLVHSVESMAYVSLSSHRLDRLVGIKGECCVPGAKSPCEDESPYVCTTDGLVCESGTTFDNCGDPICEDADSNQSCESQRFADYSITATTCHGVSGGQVYCDPGEGTHCMYYTATATVDFSGCGMNSICSSTSGPACQ